MSLKVTFKKAPLCNKPQAILDRPNTHLMIENAFSMIQQKCQEKLSTQYKSKLEMKGIEKEIKRQPVAVQISRKGMLLGTIQILRNQEGWVGGVGQVITQYHKNCMFY